MRLIAFMIHTFAKNILKKSVVMLVNEKYIKKY